MTVYVDDMKADFLPNHAPGRRYVKHHRTDQQWKPETTDRGWHWLRRRDSLEWRLAFRDRLEVGWRVSDLIGRTVAMSCGKVGRFSAYHGPVQRPEPRGPPRDEAALARGAHPTKRALISSEAEETLKKAPERRARGYPAAARGMGREILTTSTIAK
jgi:hypothetical protein